VILWEHALERRFVAKRFVAVEPGFLYRSGQISEHLIRGVLEENRIGAIVALQHYDVRREAHRAQRRAGQELGIEQLNLHLRGNGTGDPANYVEAIAAIQRHRVAGERVLVHCAAGVRRTAAVIAAYQVLVEGVRPELAGQELLRFTSAASLARSPLIPFLNDHMDEIAAGLVAKGVIPRVPEPLPRFPLPRS
jgi:hypothetical protein